MNCWGNLWSWKKNAEADDDQEEGRSYERHKYFRRIPEKVERVSNARKNIAHKCPGIFVLPAEDNQ